MTLDVLVEVDVGAHRCGVAPGAPRRRSPPSSRAQRGLRLARPARLPRRARSTCARRPSARRRSPPRRRSRAQSKAAIEAAGLACPIVTGAGTGTWQLERDSGVWTELQPGSYVFMDADYAAQRAGAATSIAFEQSLFVLATVMSAPRPERAVVDAGLKAFAFDSGLPLVLRGARRSTYVKASDEHGVLAVAAGALPPARRRPRLARPRPLRPDGQSLRLDRRRARRARRVRVAGRGARRAGLIHAASRVELGHSVTSPRGVRSIAASRGDVA